MFLGGFAVAARTPSVNGLLTYADIDFSGEARA